MGDFETLHFTQDFRDLLASFAIPLETYQRLEFIFRQILMKCPATQFEFESGDQQIRLQFTPEILYDIQDAINVWTLANRGREYGFGLNRFHVAHGRSKARTLYRRALKSFDALFAASNDSETSEGLEDRWLIELAHKLRFHISIDPIDSNTSLNASDDHLCYLAISEAIFRPFFESHFQNRQHTSEKYHEFLSLKRMMEQGQALDFETFASSELTLQSISGEVDRLEVLPYNWLELLRVSARDEKAA